jgi:ABC-type Mn2+/Zn2+ transport system permease subunit
MSIKITQIYDKRETIVIVIIALIFGFIALWIHYYLDNFPLALIFYIIFGIFLLIAFLRDRKFRRGLIGKFNI